MSLSLSPNKTQLSLHQIVDAEHQHQIALLIKIRLNQHKNSALCLYKHKHKSFLQPFIVRFSSIRHILQSHSIELIPPKSLLMSCSKPLPPYVCDSLYYLNRNQLELFSIICRPLKNFIDRYFHSKPYRVFGNLWIYKASCAVFQNDVKWHPNRDDYSVQQFLAGQKCIVDKSKALENTFHYVQELFSFTQMRPYLSPIVRIEDTTIYPNGDDFVYSPEHIEEMESLAYLWSNHKISILNLISSQARIFAEEFQPILKSPTILKCRQLRMTRSHFSFKDYPVLCKVKEFEIYYDGLDYKFLTKSDEYLAEFLEQPGVKPIVILRTPKEITVKLLDRLSKNFSSASAPNSFKIIFVHFRGPLTEFREINNTSGEKLELKKGPLALYYQKYTLERSSIA